MFDYNFSGYFLVGLIVFLSFFFYVLGHRLGKDAVKRKTEKTKPKTKKKQSNEEFYKRSLEESTRSIHLRLDRIEDLVKQRYQIENIDRTVKSSSPSNKTVINQHPPGSTIDVKTVGETSKIEKVKESSLYYLIYDNNRYWLRVKEKILNNKADINMEAYLKIAFDIINDKDSSQRQYYLFKEPATVEWNPATEEGEITKKGVIIR